MKDAWVVVKVGGSLFDCPDLAERLTVWLDHFAPRVLLVAGGGMLAEAIRTLDQVHGLGEEASHGLALRAMTLSAHVLQTLLPDSRLITEIPATAPVGDRLILDAHAFFSLDDRRADHLPHHWDVTSDSLAVRVAVLAEASELILLKSRDWQGDNWTAAMRERVVDARFLESLQQAPSTLRVRIVNLRSWELALATQGD